MIPRDTTLKNGKIQRKAERKVKTNYDYRISKFTFCFHPFFFSDNNEAISLVTNMNSRQRLQPGPGNRSARAVSVCVGVCAALKRRMFYVLKCFFQKVKITVFRDMKKLTGIKIFAAQNKSS